MDRFSRIESATFDAVALPLPLSVRLSRRSPVQPAGGDNDAFTTNVQVDRPIITADVRLRGTASAEEFSLGRQGTLSFTIARSAAGGAKRTITLTGAVLVAVELSYEQASMSAATLRFFAESQNGTTDPFAAEDE